jgi:hypothetical protein
MSTRDTGQAHLSENARSKIETLLCQLNDDGGYDPNELQIFFAGIERIINAYKTTYEFSRDSIPGIAELSRQMDTVTWHLEQALNILRSSFLTMTWPDALPGKSERPGDFAKALCDIYTQACESATHLHEAIEKDAPLTVTQDGESIRHVRRTRTNTRDKTLIRGVVLWLEIGGIDLHSHEGLDIACEIIQGVLNDQGITCPDPGDTTRDGEVAQGRLRRLIEELRSQT